MLVEITVPRLGWTMEEGTFVGWLKQNGESVRAGEPLFTLESEKATQEIEATENGILQIASDAPTPGSTVRVGVVLGYLVPEGQAAQPKALDAVRPATPSDSAPPAQERENVQDLDANWGHEPGRKSPHPQPLSHRMGEGGRRPGEGPFMEGTPVAAPQKGREVRSAERSPEGITISPRARRTAEELGVDWTHLHGTGRTGRIRERDVLAAASKTASVSTRDLPAPSAIQLPGRLIPLSARRRTIARRMAAAVHDAAPVTLTVRAEATNLIRQRDALKTAASSSSHPAPTFTDLFVKLSAAALQQHPMLNAQWRDDGLFLPDQINIAIAVDTEDGLLAPVIRDVPLLTIQQVAAASHSLAEQARAGRLAPDSASGGTFTVSNLGGLGIDTFTPILNLPQCAILGIGRIASEPVLAGDKIKLRNVVTLNLTFDHRIVDGAPAARFLATLRQFVEEPAGWLNAPPT